MGGGSPLPPNEGLVMMTELCQYLKNYFDKSQPKHKGNFVIKDGSISFADGRDIGLVEGQYIRIVGSVLNDGVVQYDDSMELADETFNGSVWSLAIPKAVIQLANDIEAWRRKYEAIDSAAMSPFNSESFGGYSYSKMGGGASDGSTNSGTWESVFASRLSVWRKI